MKLSRMGSSCQCCDEATLLVRLGAPAPQPDAEMNPLRNCVAHADHETSISMSLFFGRWMTMHANGQVNVSTHEPPTSRQRTWLKPACGASLSILSVTGSLYRAGGASGVLLASASSRRIS